MYETFDQTLKSLLVSLYSFVPCQTHLIFFLLFCNTAINVLLLYFLIMADDDAGSIDFSETNRDDGYQSRASLHYNENIPIPMKQQWMDNLNEDNFKLLDPDDPLMKRFQDALKAHLLRIDNKLSDEIKELVSFKINITEIFQGLFNKIIPIKKYICIRIHLLKMQTKFVKKKVLFYMMYNKKHLDKKQHLKIIKIC